MDSSLMSLPPPQHRKCTTKESLHGLCWFSLFLPKDTSEEIEVTLFHLLCLLIYYWYFLVVRGTQHRAQNSPLKTSCNQRLLLHHHRQPSQRSDFLVKRQRHNWSSIFTSDWLSGDPYLHLHSAIWIFMKVNGIISTSKCVWYTEEEKREKTFVYNLYTKASIWEGAERHSCSVFIRIT